MGRQKQNRTRRERPSPVTAIAGMLDLPVGIADGEGGAVELEVAGIGFAGDGYRTGDGAAYLRLADGAVKLLPEGLRPWARETLTEDLALREGGGEESLFPCRIVFGVSGGVPHAARAAGD
jgi:hypothetical protein